jgi:hypothetical protein
MGFVGSRLDHWLGRPTRWPHVRKGDLFAFGVLFAAWIAMFTVFTWAVLNVGM